MDSYLKAYAEENISDIVDLISAGKIDVNAHWYDCLKLACRKKNLLFAKTVLTYLTTDLDIVSYVISSDDSLAMWIEFVEIFVAQPKIKDKSATFFFMRTMSPPNLSTLKAYLGNKIMAELADLNKILEHAINLLPLSGVRLMFVKELLTNEKIDPSISAMEIAKRNKYDDIVALFEERAKNKIVITPVPKEMKFPSTITIPYKSIAIPRCGATITVPTHLQTHYDIYSVKITAEKEIRAIFNTGGNATTSIVGTCMSCIISCDRRYVSVGIEPLISGNDPILAEVFMTYNKRDRFTTDKRMYNVYNMYDKRIFRYSSFDIEKGKKPCLEFKEKITNKTVEVVLINGEILTLPLNTTGSHNECIFDELLAENVHEMRLAIDVGDKVHCMKIV